MNTACRFSQDFVAQIYRDEIDILKISKMIQ